jgi:hypothetical protein
MYTNQLKVEDIKLRNFRNFWSSVSRRKGEKERTRGIVAALPFRPSAIPSARSQSPRARPPNFFLAHKNFPSITSSSHASHPSTQQLQIITPTAKFATTYVKSIQNGRKHLRRNRNRGHDLRPRPRNLPLPLPLWRPLRDRDRRFER